MVHEHKPSACVCGVPQPGVRVCMSLHRRTYVEKYKNLHFLEQQLSELNRSEQDRLEVSGVLGGEGTQMGQMSG